MNTKKFGLLISRHYLCHGVRVKLRFVKCTEAADRIIYRLKLEPGTRVSAVFASAPDIQSALRLPLFQVFKSEMDIYLAVSMNPTSENSLSKMLTSRAFQKFRGALPIALGFDPRGEMIFIDLAKVMHAMYAGSTNSGKSAGLVSLVLSLSYRLSVNKVNFLLFDVGASSMDIFDGLPLLSHPIIKDAETAAYVLQSLVDELERRIQLDISELRELPGLVVVIDEYVSLLSNLEKGCQAQMVTNAITNLLRRGRHAKIHVVLATQDPTKKDLKVDVDNLTARMAFRCTSYQNSIAILNEVGAEKLDGRGDMLFKSSGCPHPVRLQGAFMPPNEVKRLVEHIKKREHDFHNKFLIPVRDSMEAMVLPVAKDTVTISEVNGEDVELARVIMWTLQQKSISASRIMKQFAVGNRAYGIADQLYELGLISKQFAKQPRQVLPQSVEEIPDGVMTFLLSSGFSTEDVENAFCGRTGRLTAL